LIKRFMKRMLHLFQSTRPRGARPDAIYVGVAPMPFQSTRPRGARPELNRNASPPRSFNPRARGGRDFFR